MRYKYITSPTIERMQILKIIKGQNDKHIFDWNRHNDTRSDVPAVIKNNDGYIYITTACKQSVCGGLCIGSCVAVVDT